MQKYYRNYSEDEKNKKINYADNNNKKISREYRE